MLSPKHKFVYIIIGIILVVLVKFMFIKEIKSSMFEERKIPKILIYTQARSGSTFLLSLMKVRKNVIGFSEPFFDIMQEEFVRGPGNVQDKIYDLMDCKFQTLKFPDESEKRKQIRQCQGTEARVMKTIRLRFGQMESWIEQSDLKV